MRAGGGEKKTPDCGPPVTVDDKLGGFQRDFDACYKLDRFLVDSA